MSKTEYTTELTFKVYDDSTGEHVSVGTDADSLGLVEFRQVDHKEKITGRIVVPVIQARHFHAAIGKYLETLPDSEE